MVHKEILMHRE